MAGSRCRGPGGGPPGGDLKTVTCPALYNTTRVDARTRAGTRPHRTAPHRTHISRRPLFCSVSLGATRRDGTRRAGRPDDAAPRPALELVFHFHGFTTRCRTSLFFEGRVATRLVVGVHPAVLPSLASRPLPRSGDRRTATYVVTCVGRHRLGVLFHGGRWTTSWLV